MKLSSYARVWLDNGKGPRIKETSDYVKFLEAEVERLREFSPYSEDHPEVKHTEEMNANSALFGGYRI